MITIQDIKDEEDVRTVSENIIDKHFRYAYCATCHSRQGQSISSNIHNTWVAKFISGKQRMDLDGYFSRKGF